MKNSPRHFALLGLLTIGTALRAANYYLDPLAGDNASAGTRDAPWGSLTTVAANDKVFAAGDVLILLAGHHGSPVLRNVNPGMVTVRPEIGARVTLKNLTIQSGRFWTVTGLEISPETAPTPERVTLVTLNGGSDNIIRHCLIYTARNIAEWTATDWNTRACNGIFIDGTRQLVEDNHVANVNFALSVAAGASHNTVRGNLIENFSGDGMRGPADFCVFEGNVVKNLYKVNANHPDAFQSWSQTAEGVGRGVIRGVVLRGNYFLSYDNPNRPFRGSLHGIGCFDGFFEDWVIENNVILTNAWHGIALYGARNCRIVNNTVADLDPADPQLPWIKITAHKNGTPSSGNLVRNNLVSNLAIDRGTATVDHNFKEPDSRRFFAGWAERDLRLSPGSAAVDAGTAEGAPLVDFTGASRRFPGNVAWDIGAYEWGASVESEAHRLKAVGEPKLNVPSFPAEK